MLKSVKINGVGPVANLEGTFGTRLNLITGENGLGKTFLLDVLFWALADAWPLGRMALPDAGTDTSKSPTVEWQLAGKNDFSRKELSAYFDFNAQAWHKTTGRHAPKSLIVYAGSNGHFAVWDPERNWSVDPASPQSPHSPNSSHASHAHSLAHPPAFQFDSRSLANGLKEGNRSYCNGLIHDWVNWYYQGSKPGGGAHFKHLETLIELLSPPDMPLKCGVPRNVFAGDAREFPTLQLPYGEIAYPHWPGGIKRVVWLAYLLVWAWHEHLRAAKQRKDQPATHLILLVDDLEAHLSPQWQRTILMALTRLAPALHPDMRAQVFVGTQSPIVLASLEPHYDERSDMLFWLNREGKEVRFLELFWVKHGDINAWLTSIVFNLKHPRSVEAEHALLAALQYLGGDTDKLKEGLKTKAEIGAALQKYLPNNDGFLEYWENETKVDPQKALDMELEIV